MSNTKPITKFEDSIITLDIWSVMDYPEAIRKFKQQALDEKMWAEFLNNDLEKIIGKSSITELKLFIEENTPSLFELVAKIKAMIEDSGRDFGEILFDLTNEFKKKAIHEEIGDFEENNATKHIIEKLRELYKEEQWTKMHPYFKQLKELKK